MRCRSESQGGLERSSAISSSTMARTCRRQHLETPLNPAYCSSSFTPALPPSLSPLPSPSCLSSIVLSFYLVIDLNPTLFLPPHPYSRLHFTALSVSSLSLSHFLLYLLLTSHFYQAFSHRHCDLALITKTTTTP